MRIHGGSPVLMASLLAGCSAVQTPASHRAAPEPSAALVSAVSVHQISTSDIAGTAVHLGEGRLLTSRHLLTSPVLEFDGVLTGYTVLASGPESEGRDRFVHDWAFIKLNDVTAPSPPAVLDLDPRGEAAAGRDLYLIGYPAKGELTRAQVREVPRSVVKARIVSLPFYLRGPREGLIYVKPPEEETYTGLSGGAAAYYDHEEDRLKIVGIYQGTVASSFFGRPFWKRHVVRKIPLPVP
ncbi:MAG: serine protease family protein [Planctomycetota bacterium]|jgi:hypothetical protein